jgi:hypothetical protein
MAIGAELAMLGTAGAAFAPGLDLLLAAQAATGAGWALLLCAAFSGALVMGHTGREGVMSGALQATLALAALARIGIVTTVAPAPAVAWVPAWPGGRSTLDARVGRVVVDRLEVLDVHRIAPDARILFSAAPRRAPGPRRTWGSRRRAR